jgi:hypothetical protein
MLGTMISILAAGVAVALWMNALAARELASNYSRRLCQEAGLQLLDQTVTLQRIGFTRIDGRLAFRRQYGFEVSFDGTDRHRGSINMLGRRVGNYSLPTREVDTTDVIRPVTLTII